jgi:adenine specific DNA methylase Mod
MEAQLQEWRELGMVDDKFQKEHVWEHNLVDGKHLHPRYRYLPIDTKHFPDLELPIVALFDNLDDALDGWLIKSENYQALNTILPKFRGKVQTIYIDPPFNKEQDADYHYSVKYKDATWITLLENRVRLGREMLNEKGAIFVRCDYNGNMYVRLMMNEIFGRENFRNEIFVKRGYVPKGAVKQYQNGVDSVLFYAKNLLYLSFRGAKRRIEEEDRQWISLDMPGQRKTYEKQVRYFFGKPLLPPKGQHWGFSQKKIDEYEKLGWIRINYNRKYIDTQGNEVVGMPEYLKEPELLLDTNWTDIKSYETHNTGFPTENAEILLKRVIEGINCEDQAIVMDFFLGSGTTVAVAHKLGRKWLGVEMGEHFYTVVLPRMKRVLFYDKSGISKEKDVRERYNEQNAGGFFKYYELEQFEDALRRTRYAEDDLFTPPADEDPCQYLFLRDLKMLEALEVNLEQGTVQVDLSRLYENIDLPETLSNLTGKWIRRIDPDPNDSRVPVAVEFADGERVELRSLDWRRIKPLIWW